MGMLDDLTAKVTSALSGAAASAGTSTAVASEDPSVLIAHVLELINSPQMGGVEGLVQRFQDRGLGKVVAGWVSTGPNPPISPAQVETVLGSQQLGLLAGKTGLSLPELTGKLAIILPIIVDHLTPDGKVPSLGSLFATALDWLKGKQGAL